MGDWYNNAQYTNLGHPINYGGDVNMAMYPGPVYDGTSLGAGIGGLSMVPMPQAPQINGNFQAPSMAPAPSLIGPNGSVIPATGAGGGGGLGSWLSNGQNLGVAIQGFGTLAGAYLGFQQLKAAKEGLKFQKDAFNTNLINSTQNYNTSLEDRIRGRTSDYDGKEADVQSYLAKHSLKSPAKK
jgi:hypothetical protein